MIRENVIQWAKDKSINDPIKQTLKTLSEAGELADAVCASNLDRDYDVEDIHNLENIVDAIGDIEVCLTILKEQLGLSQDGCLEAAWDEIKNRTGKTVNGTFIKDV